MIKAKGDEKGEFRLTVWNEEINIFEPYSVVGRSCEIEQGGRSVAIGNFGKIGESDVPIWDKGPHPCSKDTSLPHGGGDKEICKIYK